MRSCFGLHVFAEDECTSSSSPVRSLAPSRVSPRPRRSLENPAAATQQAESPENGKNCMGLPEIEADEREDEEDSVPEALQVR
eukprot:523938-Pleurochrysis_carterae.AAC.1